MFRRLGQFLIVVTLAHAATAQELQQALVPAGPQSQRIEHLWWVFFWVCVVVYVLVMLVVTIAIARKHRAIEEPAAEPPTTTSDPAGERRLAVTVSSAVVISAFILTTLVVAEFVTARSLHGISTTTSDPLQIRVIGHQWWWEIQYKDPTPSNWVSDANEIHIPVGRPVMLELQAADVIHSLWIPMLHGKKDLVPGHPTTHWIQADKAGNYFAQCAEYCGYQHAKMRLIVVADDEQKFQSFLASSRQPARAPTTPGAIRGQQVFLTKTCSMCHTVMGTTAGGRVGPDLTHLASRSSLAAGWLPNTPGHLAGWIVDPQQIKPGVRMPQNNLDAEDLRALLEYLEGLQ
jgi:cytochrome c oxidase subunit 2